LSRYDATGLCWLLQGKRVTALTAHTAAIENPATGRITTYRRYNKPSYGPLGDNSLVTRQYLLALQAFQEMANLFEGANGRPPQSNHELLMPE
jgi:hypothetical protein